MRRVPRLRRILLLVLLLLVVGILGGVAVVDPFHLRNARWFTAGLGLVALVLGTTLLATVVGRGVFRALVLVVGGAAVLGWVAVVWLASGLAGQARDTTVVDGDGRRLVVLETVGFSIDPLYSVVVRAGSGPFEQESLVYASAAEAPAPSEVRFVDADSVEIRTGGGCVYRSEVEMVTLAVDPLHLPQSVGGC